MNTRSSAQDMPCQICYLNYPNSVSVVQCYKPMRFYFYSRISVTILTWHPGMKTNYTGAVFAAISDRLHGREKVSSTAFLTLACR